MSSSRWASSCSPWSHQFLSLSREMKTTYIYLFVIVVLVYGGAINKRDKQLLKQYDACLQSTQHPDCPDSWKTKPAFSHR